MRSLATALRLLTPILLAPVHGACASTPSAPYEQQRSETTGSSGSLLVTGVSIVDLERETTSAPQDILIEAGRIIQIAPAETLVAPADTPRLEARGRFAMAGLIDVHAHMGEGGIAPNDEAAQTRALRQFLRYGVTTIFVPGGTAANDTDLADRRERCLSQAGTCPGLYGSGSLITAPGSHPMSTIFNMAVDPPAPAMEAVGVTILQADTDIDALIAAKQAAGVDGIKIIIEDGPPPWYPKPRLTNGQVHKIVEAAGRHALPVFAHVSNAEHVRVALEARVDAVMHTPIRALPDEMLRRMAEQRMAIVTSLALYEGFITGARKEREPDPYALAGVEPSAIESLTAPHFLDAAAEDEVGARDYLANASDNIRRAQAVGVPVVLGTDVNNPFVFPGYSVHEELVLMVRAGLTRGQALRAGTLGGAMFLRASERVGRLAPGYEADIILLSRNPLTEIENSRSIIAVISDGIRVPDVVGLP